MYMIVVNRKIFRIMYQIIEYNLLNFPSEKNKIYNLLTNKKIL